MATVILTKCDEVAKRELAYLYDIQVNLQELNKFFHGKQYFDINIAPKLVKPVDLNTDYLEQV